MDELKRHIIECLLDDITNEDVLDGPSFTDEGLPNKNNDVLEYLDIEQSLKIS